MSRIIALAIFFAATVCGQIPETSPGHLLSAWLAVGSSGDREKIQQFLDQHMTWAKLDQMVNIWKQSGGYDVKKVLESSNTRLVVLAQERGEAKSFVRLNVNVTAGEPEKIAGLLIQPAQPPPDLAPPKMTDAEAAAARNAPPFHQFSAWLEAFNSADRDRIAKFLEANYPSMKADAQMSFRRQTGGFELRSLERSTATTLTGLLQERDSDQFARFTITVAADEPHQIVRLNALAIPRPSEFPVAKLTDEELVVALKSKLTKDAAADRFSGTVLIAKKGKPLLSGAYGLADREKNLPNTIDTRFRIGSMNKMFTATAVLQLAQAGKLALTDPLGKYITDYPNHDIATKVTIHNLLTHTGGTGDFFGQEFAAHRLELKTLNDYIGLFGKRGPAFEPGSQWAYSNYGMILAGVVVERVSHQSYYDYVAEHVYKPAGMTRTGSEPEDQTVGGRAVGYMQNRDGGGWKPNTDTLPYRGTSAGGGYSTVTDLLNFAEALMSHKLLNAEYTDLLISGKVDTGGGAKYAYGFEDGRKNGEGAVGHSGGAPGMNGDLRIFPSSGYVIAVLSNLDPPAANRISGFVEARLKP
jgi:CubicO group peptidase (beta-lactamase class C family)